MKSYVKSGLIVGTIALLITIPVTSIYGICGPFISIIAGAIAGYFAINSDKAETKRDNAQSGKLAGLIAGVFIFAGQLIGGIWLMLSYYQRTGYPVILSNDPSVSLTVYYFTGVGMTLFLGLVGLLLSTLAGKTIGEFRTPESSTVDMLGNTQQNK